jgi:hypothetical protein
MCRSCPVKALCTGKAKGGREIERSEFAEAVESNGLRYLKNPGLYRKRQEWNEHIFGTIKRVWGYNYTNLKGLKKVNGEMALVVVYNIKRVLNILDFDDLLKKLRTWKPDYKALGRFLPKLTQIFAICDIQFFSTLKIFSKNAFFKSKICTS